MKTTLLILIIVGLVFFLSCNKNSDAIEMKQVTSSSKVDTVIFAIDTLQYSFGSFGAKDELSVIRQPSHARLFELTVQQATDKVLQYAPQNEYLGIDSIVVLSKHISEETEPVIKIDSILIVVRILKNITHRNVIGKWIMTFHCGGFVAGCDSIDPANTSQLEFGYNMVCTQSFKGSLIANFDYYLTDSLGVSYICVIDDLISEDIEGDFVTRYFKFYNEYLIEERTRAMDIYSRLKE